MLKIAPLETIRRKLKKTLKEVEGDQGFRLSSHGTEMDACLVPVSWVRDPVVDADKIMRLKYLQLTPEGREETRREIIEILKGRG